jgi:hypothetical protein
MTSSDRSPGVDVTPPGYAEPHGWGSGAPRPSDARRTPVGRLSDGPDGLGLQAVATVETA